MRIIAGANKGRTLKAPRWDGLRPTSDKLRGTLFNNRWGRLRAAVLGPGNRLYITTSNGSNDKIIRITPS